MVMMAAHDSVTSTMGNSYGGGKTDHQFPAGLRVLVVDDDPTCLKILDKMLKRCLYQVTTCCRATAALSMLRENKGAFDLVISDVYMPDMDGFKLLEQVGLEMDLPVIMMSADGGTSTVMKGIKHGACDYLIKPIRLEELKNIWQHVIRKKRNEPKDFDLSGSFEDNDRHRKGSDDVDYASSVNEGTDGNWKLLKKRKEAKEEEDDGEEDNDDPSASKKPRVVWSVELHQQFVNAVNQLGIDKAVPKRILELMHVQGLTRENVASHLQKYRLYLKRLSGVAQQQSGMNSSFGGTTEAGVGPMGLLGRLDLQRLAASGQISPQALVTLPAELLGQVNPNNGLGLPNIDRTLLLQAAFHGVNSNPLNRGKFGQPLMNSQGNLLQGLPRSIELKQFSQPQQHIPSFGNLGLPTNDASAGFSMLQQQHNTGAEVGSVDCGINNNGASNPQNNAMVMQLIQQQQQHQINQQQQQLQRSAAQQQPGGQLQGSQLQSGQVLNLPSASIVGPQVLPNEIRGRATLSSLANGNSSLGNNIIGAPGSGQLNRMPMPAYGLGATESNVPEGIGRMSTVDYKSQNVHILQGNDYSLSSTVCLSSPLTTSDIEGGMNISGIKRLGGISDIVGSPTLSCSGISFGTSNGIGQNLSQSGRQGWQMQNVSMNQDLSQTATAILSPCHGQASHRTQGLNVPVVQDPGQVRSFGFVGKGPNLSSRLVQNAGYPGMLSNAQSQGELLGIDSGLRLKDKSASDFGLTPKIECGTLSDHFPSEDLMNLLFKQQQDGMGISENEFNLDGVSIG